MIHSLRHYSPINQEILKQAASNILVYMHRVIPPPLFHFLLQKVKAGVEVKILCPEQVWHQVGLTSWYMKNFRQNGGEIHWLTDSQNITAINFLIIDQQYLLRSPLNPSRKKWKFEASSDQVSIATYLQLFQGVETETLMPEKSSALAQKKENKLTQVESKTIDQRLQIEFKLLPNQIKANELFELHWKVIGAQKVSISHGIGEVAPKGSRLLRAVKSTDFQLEATSEWGQQLARCHLAVDPFPVIEYHISTPDWPNDVEIPLREKTDLPDQYGIIKGQMIRLRWTIYLADSVTLSEIGEIPSSGYKDLVPQSFTCYSIVAKNKHHTVEQKIIVHVFETPDLNLNPPRVMDLPNAKIVLPSPPTSLSNPDRAIQVPNFWKNLKNFFNTKKTEDE